MRVACVSQDPGVGPGRRKGAAVHLAAMRGAFRARGVEVHELDVPDDTALKRRLAELLDGAPPDLVYERHALGRTAACRFALRHGIPHVLEVNAPLVEEEERWRGPVGEAARRAEAWLFGHAPHVFAVSSAVADYALAQGADPASVAVRTNRVDAGLFRPRRPADPQRRYLGAEERLVLGFHGRLRPWHGLERVAEAAGRALARGIDVHLLLVGEGDFEAAAGDRLPADRLTVLDWRPPEELAAWVAACDVLPLGYGPDSPCYFAPLKLAEAMAAGVVPVVPALGDLPELVPHGVRGLVYPAGDVDALAEHLEELGRSPELRARLGRAARRAAEELSWDSLAAEVLELARAGRPRRAAR